MLLCVSRTMGKHRSPIKEIIEIYVAILQRKFTRIDYHKSYSSVPGTHLLPVQLDMKIFENWWLHKTLEVQRSLNLSFRAQQRQSLYDLTARFLMEKNHEKCLETMN